MKFFKNNREAQDYLNFKKQTNCDRKTIYILTDGPEDNYVVMTLKDFYKSGLRDAGFGFQF